MIHRIKVRTRISLIPLILVIGISAGCAVKTAKPWGDPQTGLILQYRMLENQILKYQLSTDQSQSMDVMGQTIETQTDAKTEFSVQSKGKKGNNHQLRVTIDSMALNIDGPQGPFSPDMSSVIGKSFEMSLSPLGKELDLAGAKSIQYDLGSAGKRSVLSNFQAMFSDLAGVPVKIGDTWTAEDMITEEFGSGELRIHITSTNTLEGYETIDGLECAKIRAKATGTMEGQGEQGGMDLSVEGDLEGNETWYFAYKEGIFVKTSSDISIEGTVTISPQNMTIPMRTGMKIEVKLKER